MNALPQQHIIRSEAYPHQEMAAGRILEKFETEDLTHIFMACDTGKTIVCPWFLLIKNYEVRLLSCASSYPKSIGLF